MTQEQCSRNKIIVFFPPEVATQLHPVRQCDDGDHAHRATAGLSALVEEKLRALAPLRDDRAPIVENNRHVVPLTIVVSFSFLLGTYRA